MTQTVLWVVVMGDWCCDCVVGGSGVSSRTGLTGVVIVLMVGVALVVGQD